MKNTRSVEECILAGVFMYEEPITLSRNCAMVFGAEMAIVAQQFIYWVFSKKCKLEGEMFNDRKWVRFGYKEMAQNEFPWMSERSVRRRIDQLEACGFLIGRTPDTPGDMRRRYTVNHGVVAAIETGKLNHLTEDGRLVFRSSLEDVDADVAKLPSDSDVANLAKGFAKMANSLTNPISPYLSGIKEKPEADGNSPVNGNAEVHECFNLEANPEAEPEGQGAKHGNLGRRPSPDKYTDARKVLAHLNAATSSHYRETPGNLALIHGRLLEVTGDVGGVLQMIDRMVAKWGQDPKMADFLCPTTLFRKSNFGGYYDNRDKPVISIQPKPAQKPIRPMWAVRKELKERLEAVKAKLRFHGGFKKSGTYIPEMATPAMIADAEKLVKERDELQSKLDALPPEDE